MLLHVANKTSRLKLEVAAPSRETIDFQSASSKPCALADLNKCFAATVIGYLSRKTILRLFDSTSKDHHPQETAAMHLPHNQRNGVENGSIPSSPAQETNACQKATNEHDILVCCERNSIAILLADY
jgi:hypothetical protein